MRHRLGAADDVRVVGEAASGEQALEAIRRLAPDVVFLDIEMPDGNGLDVVAGLQGASPPMIVFVTAYHEYAVDAFEARALDYVLKPVSRERLEEVLARIRARRETERDASEHRRLLERIGDLRADLRQAGAADRPAASAEHAGGVDDARQRPTADDGRIAVRRGGAYTLVELASLDWLEAAGNYVRLHEGERSLLHRSTLSELEERLPADRFRRVHRSAIVNLDSVERIVPTDSGDHEIHLQTGHVVRLSRSYRDRVLG